MDSGATPVSRGTEPVHLLGQGVYYAYARDRDGIMYERSISTVRRLRVPSGFHM